MLSKDETYGCLDKISNLPQDVLNDIFMCLPLRDVLRTSILSKKWRYKWCRLPQLVLDETLYKETSEGNSTILFTNIIHHILTHHEGPITKCTLNTLYFESGRTSKIDNLMYFLSRNGIQHLVLRLRADNSHSILPTSIFACSKLTHLALDYCSIQRHPPTFKGFDRLICLELHSVKMSSKNLGSLISYCPLLEQLLLRRPILFDISEINAPMTDVIEIIAPMLRSFSYWGSISSICLKYVPLLEKLLLADSELKIFRAENVSEIVKFFESFSSLKHLQLHNMFLSPGAGEIPARLPFVLHSVKDLRVLFFFGAFDVVLCVLRLMRSFPYLQYLEVLDLYDTIPAPVSPEVLELFSDLTFNHLREVKLEGIKFEMQLIKLLLAKSPVLERMLVNLCELNEPARVNIILELSRIKPASPIAKIDFIF